MNNNSDFKDTRGDVTTVALGFVLGAVVGAGVALLLAPGTGTETRRRIVGAGERWGNAVKNRVRDTVDLAKNGAGDLRQDATSALEAGRDAFEQSARSHQPRAASRS
jgi:gas vesicle protein